MLFLFYLFYLIRFIFFFFFFFNDTATTEIYTLSLHDALPIYGAHWCNRRDGPDRAGGDRDRKSTRLNSSHEWISYAVFCLKKKKKKNIHKSKKKKIKKNYKLNYNLNKI